MRHGLGAWAPKETAVSPLSLFPSLFVSYTFYVNAFAGLSPYEELSFIAAGLRRQTPQLLLLRAPAVSPVSFGGCSSR